MPLSRRAKVSAGLWIGWGAVALILAGSALAEMKGDVATGPCAGEQAAAAVRIHLEPGLLNDASWADFNVPESATHLVLCQDGGAMSYHILSRGTDSVRMRIGNRWVLEHMVLDQDLDLYSQADRWTLLYDPPTS